MNFPETINRRLANIPFIAGPANERHFQELVGVVRAMAERNRRDVEKYIPDILEAGAWSKAYAMYEAFVELERTQEADPVMAQRTLAAAATEEQWNRFLRSRDELIDLIQRGRESRQMQEFIGLADGDLDQPIDTDPETVCLSGGKRPGWQSRAYRVNNALGKLRDITNTERQTVPFVMTQRRLEAENLDLRNRIEALEAIVIDNQPKEQAA